MNLSIGVAQLVLHLACDLRSICLLLPAMQTEGSPVHPVLQVEQIASEENSIEGNPYIRGIEAFNLNVQHLQRLGSASQVRPATSRLLCKLVHSPTGSITAVGS